MSAVYHVDTSPGNERIGFVLEGRLRGTHPKEGNWYDSLAMGLVSNEYSHRRARLLGTTEVTEMSAGPTYTDYLEYDAFDLSGEERRWL